MEEDSTMSSDTSDRNISRQGRVNQRPVEYYKRDVEDRVRDFEEVILGFDDESAMA